MSWRKLARPGAKVQLKLTAAERRLLRHTAGDLAARFPQLMASTSSRRAVLLTLDEWDDLLEYLGDLASRSDDSVHGQQLVGLCGKVQDLLDQYTEEDRPLLVDQATIKITRALSDLLAGCDEGVISFRLRPRIGSTRPPDVRLKLTAAQCQALLSATKLNASLRRRLAGGTAARTIHVTRAEAEQLLLELDRASLDEQARPYRRQLDALRKKLSQAREPAPPATLLRME